MRGGRMGSDRALPSLNPLLRYAALVVDCDDALGWPREFGEDAADAQIKLAGVLISRFAQRALSSVRNCLALGQIP